MNEVVQISRHSVGFGKRCRDGHPDVDAVQGRSGSPINIQINVDHDDEKPKRARSFPLLRSKILWFLVMLVVAGGMSYVRVRSICQVFKDSGRFYYGMDVNRCVGILIKEPLASVESHFARINNSY